ncbi:MAG: GtrA family protein [Steroidobacteraceae bacterium]
MIAALLSRSALAHFVRFAAVGVCGTAAHYSVLWSLVEFGTVHVLVATSIGFAVGALVNYVLNRRFTFDSDATHVDALPKFLAVAFLGAIINGLIVKLFTQSLGVYYLIAQLFATGTVLVWNFAVNYLWTFRR